MLVILAIAALYIGVYDFNGVSPFTVLCQFISGDPNLALSDKYVIWEVRAARIIMAILIGSMLAVSGTSLQGLFKNPLATGEAIGLTSGATLLAAIAIVLGGHFKQYLPEMVQFSLTGISAFIGALLAMMLGERDAQHLGINVERLKKQIVIITSLMVGTCVAFSGTIGFVGLILPYILRLLFKSNYTFILPLSAVLGSILLLIADTISRSILAPSELPIGILTSLIGGPIFIAILIKFKKSL